MLHTVRQPRWLGYLALTVVVATVCSLLGLWQFARREQALTANALVESNWNREPEPLADVLPRDRFDESQRWTPVSLEGEYLVEHRLFVRNRPRDGKPGFLVVVPFQLSDGRIIAINRGWVPTEGLGMPPASREEAPEGVVRVSARLKDGEPKLVDAPVAAGQIGTIHLPTIADFTDENLLLTAHAVLSHEQPAATNAPLPVPKPPLEEGPHLSYALQWFIFAAMAFVAWGYSLRQEHLAESGVPARKLTRKRTTDADAEDAFLERSVATTR